MPVDWQFLIIAICLATFFNSWRFCSDDFFCDLTFGLNYQKNMMDWARSLLFLWTKNDE